jgi:hypothetical protein
MSDRIARLEESAKHTEGEHNFERTGLRYLNRFAPPS